MDTASSAHFDRQYQRHLQHLKLKGLQPKTIEAYARAIRRIGKRFDQQIDESVRAAADRLLHRAAGLALLERGQARSVRAEVLLRPCPAQALGGARSDQAAAGQRLPDIVTVEEAQRIFAATRVASYRVFFFTLYSLGLRLGEGLRLQVGDIDAVRSRVHIRDSKGNRDRFVPLPQATHRLLQRFWQVHRNPVLLFPNRHGGLKGAARATTPLDRGGVQTTLHRVVQACGLKKRSPLTACATATPPT